MQHASEYAIEYKWGLLIFKFLLPKYRARILTYECLILMIGRILKTNVGCTLVPIYLKKRCKLGSLKKPEEASTLPNVQYRFGFFDC